MDVREKLVELLNKGAYACVGTDCFEGCKYFMESDCLHKLMVDEMIANGVTVQKWIPASEPPKEKGRYWCNVKSFSFPGKYYQTVLKWDDGFIEGSIYTDDVTHWMPLPEPPKEE